MKNNDFGLVFLGLDKEPIEIQVLQAVELLSENENDFLKKMLYVIFGGQEDDSPGPKAFDPETWCNLQEWYRRIQPLKNPFSVYGVNL